VTDVQDVLIKRLGLRKYKTSVRFCEEYGIFLRPKFGGGSEENDP
jgi:hypothetical protein